MQYDFDIKQIKKTVKRGIAPDKQSNPIPDLIPMILLLSLFCNEMEQLYKFAEIRNKTAEIRALSQQMGISPKLAFNACYEELTILQHKSLFDIL